MTFDKVTFSSWAADESLHETQVSTVRIKFLFFFFFSWGSDICVSQNKNSPLAVSHRPKEQEGSLEMLHRPYALLWMVRLSL